MRNKASFHVPGRWQVLRRTWLTTFKMKLGASTGKRGSNGLILAPPRLSTAWQALQSDYPKQTVDPQPGTVRQQSPAFILCLLAAIVPTGKLPAECFKPIWQMQLIGQH